MSYFNNDTHIYSNTTGYIRRTAGIAFLTQWLLGSQLSNWCRVEEESISKCTCCSITSNTDYVKWVNTLRVILKLADTDMHKYMYMYTDKKIRVQYEIRV